MRGLQTRLDDRTIKIGLNEVQSRVIGSRERSRRIVGLDVTPSKQRDSTKSDHTPMLSCVSLMRLGSSVCFIRLQS
jgi:hypothetical protein